MTRRRLNGSGHPFGHRVAEVTQYPCLELDHHRQVATVLAVLMVLPMVGYRKRLALKCA